MIAMSIACEPLMLIADEPTTALDVTVQAQILRLLAELQKDLGLGILLITHDLGIVARVADRVSVMYAGKVVESGPTASVLRNPAHPYTMGLYTAFPDLERSKQVLTPIEGSPPDLLDPPSGCRFAARCPFAVDQCSQEPPLQDLGNGHSAACWRVADAEELRQRAREVTTWQRS
jgi:peptide/nickel transport system ATP-binding protein